MKIRNSKTYSKFNPGTGGGKPRPYNAGTLTLLFGICLLFALPVPAHAWTQTDWSEGDSQCLWYATDRYDTGVNVVGDNPTGAVSIDTGLVAYWHFNDAGSVGTAGRDADADTAYDQTSNNNDGAIHGCKWGDTSNDDSAVWGGGLSFNGTASDYVDCGSKTSLNITSAITIEAWVKMNNAIGDEVDDMNIVDKNTNYAFKFDCDNSDALQYHFYDGTAWRIARGIKTDWLAGVWYHVAVTFSKPNVVLYINGVEDDADTLAYDPTVCVNNLRLGRPGYFNGAIDEVRIYDRALSSDEIAAHADTSIIQSLGDNSPRGVLLSSTYDADSPVVWKTIEWNNPSVPGSGDEPYRRGDSRLRKDEGNLVALWHFDEGEDLLSGTDAHESTVYDESTYSNTGIVHGCVWGDASEDSAVFQSALSFDGVDDYVEVADDERLRFGTGDFTVECWLKKETPTGSYDAVIAKGDIGATEWMLYFLSGTNIRFYSSGGIDSESLAGAGDGNWHHVAFTRSGDDGYFYIDGAEKSHITGIDSVDLSTTKKLSIGAAKEGTARYFHGAIDEVAIYNYAKSPQEIWQDARGTQMRFRTQTTSSILDGTGADSAVGLWHFDDDATSETAHDSSVYGNDGELGGEDHTVGALPTWYQWGVFGKCLSFDGTNDYVDCGNKTSLNITDAITIEAWVKRGSIDSVQTIVMKRAPTGDMYYFLRFMVDNTINFGSYDGSYYQVFSISTITSTSEWYHLAGVFTGTHYQIYINGALDNSVADSTKLASGTGKLSIGRKGETAANYFNGLIDEVGIYPRAKTADEIKIDARGWSPWSHSYYKDADEDDIVLFADDFNDGETSGWTASEDGTWLIDNTIEDTGFLQISSLSDTAIIIANNTDWYDEQIEAKVKIKTAGGKAGIIYRKDDDDGANYGYVAYLDATAADSGVKAYPMIVTGRDTSNPHSASMNILPNTWYTLKVTSDGTRDRVYVDGKEKISFSNTSLTYKAKTGLYAENQTALFDDFKVHPIDRYVRYEATLSDNVCNNTTPYLYWVRLAYEDTTSDDSIWSRIWQDRYGLHESETMCPKDGTAAGNPPLNYAEIDSADTTWCYNLENYGNQVAGETPTGTIKVYVSTPADTISRVDLRLGIRKTSAISAYPNTWPEDIDDYEWSDWRQNTYTIVDIAGGIDEGVYIDTWLLTYSTTDLATDFATEGGYVLQSRAISTSEGTEPDPSNFKPDSTTKDRQDTSIIYVMRDITPPGSNISGVDGLTASMSGYTAVVCGKGANTRWTDVGVKGIISNPEDAMAYASYNNTNPEYVWFNIDSVTHDSGIRVKVEEKNPDTTRETDCSGFDEDDTSIRYRYSVDGGTIWKGLDAETATSDVATWANADTNIWTDRYIVIKDAAPIDEDKTADGDPVGTGTGTYRYSIASLDPGDAVQNSTKGDLVLIQFAQKDKAGNWGYSHRAADYYATQSSGNSGCSTSKGYYINVDLTAPKPIFTAGPRERNYTTSASFKFEDDADDSPLLCAFSTRLEKDTHDSSFEHMEQVEDWSTPYSPWSPTSHKGGPVPFTGLSSDYHGHWHRCFVKAQDEALNLSDDADSAVYVFQCLLPVPNTIIYSGPAGIVTSSTGSYPVTFKYRGEGGSITPYEFAYKIDGAASWTSWSETGEHSYTATGYGNHTFRVKAQNYGGTTTDDEDQTPASVTFTIEAPDKPSAIAPPSDPVKYWREESE